MNKVMVGVLSCVIGTFVGMAIKRHEKITGKKAKYITEKHLYVSIDEGCFKDGILTLPNVSTRY